MSMAELVASRAVRWCASALVAIATRAHAGRDFLLQHIAGFHRSMTFGTMEPGLDMRRMSKEDKIRNVIDRHPCDVLALLGGGPEFRYLGTVCFNRPMACQAEVDRRDSRLIALGGPPWQKSHGRPTFPV